MSKAASSRPAALRGLAEHDDAELLGVLRARPRDDSDRMAACEILVSRYESLVRSCVRRYRDSSPERGEDLMQVGYVGLLKAINYFDPDVGESLTAYAQPCISGEIKRHFRDKRWTVQVKRPTQELLLSLRATREELTHKLGRSPTHAELAEELGVSDDELADARRAGQAFHSRSLDAPVDGAEEFTLGEQLGDDDPGIEHALDMETIRAHWGELRECEQKILVLRFYGNLTQAEIGEQVGISQMHVSRLLSRALSYLRQCLLATGVRENHYEKRPVAPLAADSAPHEPQNAKAALPAPRDGASGSGHKRLAE